MRVRVTGNELAELKVDLAVCFAHEKDTEPRGVEDAGLRRELARQMKSDGFEGLPGDRVVWNTNGNYAARRFLVQGLGPAKDDNSDAIRSAAARASRAAQPFGAKSLGIALPHEEERATEVRAALEGALVGAYEFDRHLTDPRRRPVRLTSIEVGGGDGKVGAASRKAARLAEVGARAVTLARDLVNEAPSRMTPAEMARHATREAKAAGLRCKVLGLPELRKLGMHALLAVSRGSKEAPRLVHLTYVPKGRAKGKRRRIVLAGKGVTFDSGGLNLKPGDSMLTMKSDMAGSAAVLATMTTLAEIGCKAEVHGLLGLTENMTGGAAYKPGDILDTYKGKTVEVGNTDAEGRLVLCDVLAWAADKLRPDVVVDVATLTGACVVALGTMASGLFTRHDALRDALLAASAAAGEKLWPLPLYDEYLSQLQRGPADLRNIGDRWGGATTAALFLGEFLPRELPWAHLDIAGPAFAESDTPETRAGATGAAVPTLMRWLEQA